MINSRLLNRFGLVLMLIPLAISCKKSSNKPDDITNTSACEHIGWSNTLNNSGYFEGGVVNGNYYPLWINYEENGSGGGLPFHYDPNNHIINDQPGITYTYTDDNLTRIVVAGSNGAGNYNFDASGQFVNGTVTLSSIQGLGTVNIVYTYDNNQDPVKVSAKGTIDSQQGPVNVDLEATGDFLQDKPAFLPFSPLVAPFSGYFSLIPFLSRHLINKWTFTLTETLGGTQVLNSGSTQEFSYTFDSDGNVTTMVTSVNPNNTYTFGYSACTH